MKIEIKVPQAGESVTEAEVAEWMKQDGDMVEQNEVIVVLETDKASSELVAEKAGRLTVKAEEGETVYVDQVIGVIDTDAAGAKASAPADQKSESPKAAAAKPTGQILEIDVPQAGESVTEAEIAEWVAEDGAFVNKDDVVVVLETDKASMDIVAQKSGILKTKAEEGDTVTVGQIIAEIAVAEGGSAPAPSTASSSSSSAPAPTSGKTAHPDLLSVLPPAVQKLVTENNLDPKSIPATGKDGRLTKEDVLNFMKSGGSKPAAAPAPAKADKPAPKAPGLPVAQRGVEPKAERVRMTKLRKKIAERLVDAQQTAAILTTFNEIDMTAVMSLRAQYKDQFKEKYGISLGFMGFFVKACCEALKDYPDVNAQMDGDDIIYHNYVNMGIAVSTEKGLMVPVVQNADALSLADIELAIRHYALKARDGKIGINDLNGGTFTITNGGVFGSLMSTPILNPPQTGILGMHKIEERPMAINGKVEIRPMMYVALSYDHRVIDGKQSVSFLVRVKECIEDPTRLLMHI